MVVGGLAPIHIRSVQEGFDAMTSKYENETISKRALQCSIHTLVCCMAVLEADINHVKLHQLEIDCTTGFPWSTTIPHSRKGVFISTPDMLKCWQKHRNIFVLFSIIPSHWNDACSWNIVCWQTLTSLLYTVNQHHGCSFPDAAQIASTMLLT